jgi:hypothetical protein
MPPFHLRSLRFSWRRRRRRRFRLLPKGSRARDFTLTREILRGPEQRRTPTALAMVPPRQGAVGFTVRRRPTITLHAGGTDHDREQQLSAVPHRAWTSHDFEQARTYIAPDIVCHAPTATATPRSYATDTIPVQNAPAAEYHTISHCPITAMPIIFDRAPFDAARRATETR